MAQYPSFPYIADEENHDPAEENSQVTDGGSALGPSAIDTLVLLTVLCVASFLVWRLAKLVVPRCRGPVQPQQQPDSTSNGPHLFQL